MIIMPIMTISNRILIFK